MVAPCSRTPSFLKRLRRITTVIISMTIILVPPAKAFWPNTLASRIHLLSQRLPRTTDLYSTLQSTASAYQRVSHILSSLSSNKRDRTVQRFDAVLRFILYSPLPCTNIKVADLGCDHGLLCLSLAYGRAASIVIGGDLSDTALSNARKMHQWCENERQKRLARNETDDRWVRMEPCELHWRVGDGTNVLQPGELSGGGGTIVVAGVGVNTALSMLGLPHAYEDFVLHDDNAVFSSVRRFDMTDLDLTGASRLIVQSTNSRPRNIMKLYESVITRGGWAVEQEDIAELDGRFYLTTCFTQREVMEEGEVECKRFLPGMHLDKFGDGAVKRQKCFLKYIKHHLNWIRKDQDRIAKGWGNPLSKWEQTFVEHYCDFEKNQEKQR